MARTPLAAAVDPRSPTVERTPIGAHKAGDEWVDPRSPLPHEMGHRTPLAEKNGARPLRNRQQRVKQTLAFDAQNASETL